MQPVDFCRWRSYDVCDAPARSIHMTEHSNPSSTLTEDDFDVVFPERVRRHSPHFWTPIEVAEAAASFLAPSPLVRVLDIGSGAGKFCIVGAARTGAHFSGIEQRPHLVAVARYAA